MKGHIRQRGEKSWSVVICVGKDDHGKPRYKWHTVHGGIRKAQEERNKLLNELATGTYVEPSPMSVQKYLESWLVSYAQIKVASKTFERYKEIVDKHLIPALGEIPLCKLQPLDIQQYYSTALASGRKRGGRLSAQTVLHHHRVLKHALRQAIRWRLLVHNPADAVEPPRPAEHEMQVLDETQTAVLLKAVEDTSLHIPVLLAVTTGMRRGEILALRWADVDLNAGTLSVQQSAEQTKAGGIVFKQPKTRRSRRVVALPPIVTAALKKHRATQARARLQVGTEYKDHDLVCALWNGMPRSPGALTRAFIKLMPKLNLPRVRLHDLRHGHATLLLRQNIHPKIVSERLGHSTIGLTLDTYSHVIPGMQEEAAERIDSVLKAALRKTKRV